MKASSDPTTLEEIDHIISAVSETTKKKSLGHFDLDLLQKAVGTYRKLGLIKKDIDVSRVVSTELIPN